MWFYPTESDGETKTANTTLKGWKDPNINCVYLSRGNLYPFSFIKYSGNGQRNDITTICIVLNLLIFTPCNNLWEAQFKKPHHQEFKAQNLAWLGLAQQIKYKYVTKSVWWKTLSQPVLYIFWGGQLALPVQAVVPPSLMFLQWLPWLPHQLSGSLHPPTMPESSQLLTLFCPKLGLWGPLDF